MRELFPKLPRIGWVSMANILGILVRDLSPFGQDEKRLSAEALARAAELLGVDPVQIQLRAGVVPSDLTDKIAADPEGFLAWVLRP